MQTCLRLFATGLLVCLIAWSQEAGADPKSRARTARSLGKGGSESMPQLAAFLKDPELDVRREAVRAITSIGTQYSLDPLIAATRDNDPEIQMIAVDGIVNFYVPGYLESGLQRLGTAVRRRFDREDTQVIEPYVAVREEAVRAIAALVRGGGGMEVRASAARAAGILRGKAALPELIDSLRSKDDYLIFESLIAIQKIREPSAGPRVVFLVRDLEERVQIAAIETAGILKAREAVPDLQRVFNDSKSARVRAKSLGALAMIADPAPAQLFRTSLTDRNHTVRASAAEGLARLKNRTDLTAMERAFNEERKMEPRLANAFALVSLGNTDTSQHAPLTYLINTLNSKSYRGVAEPYLIELSRDPGVLKVLHGFLRQGTRDEKIGIVRVLSVSGDRSSVSQIEVLTKDPDSDVAQEAIRALRSLQARLG